MNFICWGFGLIPRYRIIKNWYFLDDQWHNLCFTYHFPLGVCLLSPLLYFFDINSNDIFFIFIENPHSTHSPLHPIKAESGLEYQRISIDRSKLSEDEAFEHAIEMIQVILRALFPKNSGDPVPPTPGLSRVKNYYMNNIYYWLLLLSPRS